MRNPTLLQWMAAALLAGAALASGPPEGQRAIDLSRARVVVPRVSHAPEFSSVADHALKMLCEEVEKRSGLCWGPVGGRADEDADRPQVLVESYGSTDPLRDVVHPPEGFAIRTEGPGPTIRVTANDNRGLLYAVGLLLRKLEMSPGRVVLPEPLNVTTSPDYPLRGHQLGYRPKTNSYDGWAPAQWEQYVRDLALFGCNAIELIPPKSDDDDQSPHFPLPKQEMMNRMSRIAADYGLAVWVWYPAIDGDYSQAEVAEAALGEWPAVLGQLARLDAVLVPTGDPGSTPPAILLPLLEKQAAEIRKRHEKCELWISVQGLRQPEFDALLRQLEAETPWLTGVVFGPQTRISLAELRRRLPERYPIRRYPDITHSLRCEFPVPDWDLAYGATLGREPINPRPLDEAVIFRDADREAVGFITYSEGCNDDVNKAVWSALGWNREADVIEVLRDYGRYFIGPDQADAFAQGLLALERNWRGPLSINASVMTTLAQFQDLERAATPAQLANWRFQQALYRAYYDAYTRRRLLYEIELEQQACDALRAAPRTGALAAMNRAEAILARADARPVAADLRARVFELAEALFQSARMQLSVDRYQAIALDRGANLDAIDRPLNDRQWIVGRIGEIRALSTEPERMAAIDALVRYDDPGPGGFYDDLGNPARQPHLVPGEPYLRDPGYRRSPLVALDYEPHRRQSWNTRIDGFFNTPIQMRYAGLDPRAAYRLRVVYGDDYRRVKVHCQADNGSDVHGWIDKPEPMGPLEFDIPREATADGELTLTFRAEGDRGGPGRGCQIAEVWLLREAP